MNYFWCVWHFVTYCCQLFVFQAAQFVVESFPYHCDVLAMANVLSTVFGKDAAAGSGGAASLVRPTVSGAGVNLATGNGSASNAKPTMSQGQSGLGMQAGFGNAGLNLGMQKASGDPITRSIVLLSSYNPDLLIASLT